MNSAASTTRSGTLIAALALGPMLWLADPAAGQPSAFTPVDQAVTDVSPLGYSLQDLQPDAGPPMGFDRVYTSPNYPGQYLRVNGAIVAAFPRSQYVANNNGLFPILPENTVFYIGPTLDELFPSPKIELADSTSPLFIKSRLSTLSGSLLARDVADRISQQPRPAPTRPTVWSNETVRRQRLARWLAAAAAQDPR